MGRRENLAQPITRLNTWGGCKGRISVRNRNGLGNGIGIQALDSRQLISFWSSGRNSASCYPDLAWPLESRSRIEAWQNFFDGRLIMYGYLFWSRPIYSPQFCAQNYNFSYLSSGLLCQLRILDRLSSKFGMIYTQLMLGGSVPIPRRAD